MTDTLAQARQLIQQHLAELEAESGRLDKALQSLDSKPATQSSGDKLGSERSQPKVRKRAPRGKRQRDFLAAVEAKPGIRASEAAKEIGVSSNQAYALANKLRKDGEIRKRGKKYWLK